MGVGCFTLLFSLVAQPGDETFLLCGGFWVGLFLVLFAVLFWFCFCVLLSHSQLLHTKAVESFKSQWKGIGLTPGLMSWSSKSLYVSLTWTASPRDQVQPVSQKKRIWELEIFLAAGPVRGLQGIICNLGSGDLKEAYTIWEFEIFLALAQSEGYWGTTTIGVHGFPSYLLSCHLCFCGNCFNLGSCVFLGGWPCKLAVAFLLYSGCLKIFAGLLTFVCRLAPSACFG